MSGTEALQKMVENNAPEEHTDVTRQILEVTTMLAMQDWDKILAKSPVSSSVQEAIEGVNPDTALSEGAEALKSYGRDP